jgi:seryl-tRNA(Sec) selenium transferase
VLGERKLVATARKHPLARALRVDKLALAPPGVARALADPRARAELPALAMLAASPEPRARAPTGSAAGLSSRAGPQAAM